MPPDLRVIKPVAAWADYSIEAIVIVCDNGQVYTLHMHVRDAKLSSGSEWSEFGPPIPGSLADIAAQ